MTITDDLGRTVTLAEPAKRVVPLYGALGEILAAMGQAGRIAARTDAETDTPDIQAKPTIGTHMRPNFERIMAVGPDLVLQMAGRGESLEAVERLTGLGIPVAVFDIQDFDGLFAAIARIGLLVGEPEAGLALASALQTRLAAVETALAGVSGKPKVVFEARYPNLLVAGHGSMVDAVIKAAGGENAVAGDKRLVRLSEEELLRLAPDVYLMQRGPMSPDPAPLASRPQFAGLPAAQHGRSYVVDEAVFSRPGPRSVEAAEALAAWLHPERFPAGDKGGAQ